MRENYAKEKVIWTCSEGCRSYSITFGFLIKHLDTPQKNVMESKNAGLFDSDIFCFPVLNLCFFISPVVIHPFPQDDPPFLPFGKS